MDNLSLLKDGTVIMSLGMGFVFLFLIILVYAMQIMAYVIRKINILFPEEVVETAGSSKAKTSPESEVALAIALCYAKSGKK